MQKTQEGYQVLPSIDKARYDEIQGMEGPFMTRSGKVVYYDPQEGAYYDRDTDMYLTYDEWRSLDEGYEGDLHPSIDMTRDDDELNFCYDCKLISYTLGEIDTDNDETDVVCPRCGSQAYVVASDEEIEKYGKVGVGEDSKVPNYSKMIQNISTKGAKDMKLPEPDYSISYPSPEEILRQKEIGDGGTPPPTKKTTSKKSTYMKPIISPRDIPSFGRILTNAMERMKEATGDVELLKPMINMDPKVLPIYAKNIIKKYPHLKPSVNAMIGKQESVATEGKNKMGPQGIMPGDRVEHEGDMYEVVAVDGDILTVDNLQNGNRTKFKMDDVTRLFGMDAMTDQDKDNLDAMFKRLDKVGSGSLKHVATEGEAGDHDRMYKVVHVKKGMMDIKAKTSYEAAKKFAKEKGLKSTAGVDVHLYPLEEAIPKSTMYGLVIDGEYVAKGSKADMRKLQKEKGGTVYNAPGKKVGDKAGVVKEGVKRNILYREIGKRLAKGHTIDKIKKHYKDIDDKYPGHIEKIVQALKDRNEIPEDATANLDKNFFRKIASMDEPHEEINRLLTADGPEGDVIRREYDITAGENRLHPDDDFEEILDMMVANFEDMTMEGFASDAQRKAAFASGYDPSKKKKNETVDISKLKASINMTEATDSEAVAGYVRTLLNSKHNTWEKVDKEIDFVINKLSEGHQAYAEEARTELHKRWMQEYFDKGIKVNENIDTIRKIVANKSAMPVKFDDGSMKIDMTSANIFLQAYDKMKDRNQEKINQMIQTKAGFLRVMDFIYGAMK